MSSYSIDPSLYNDANLLSDGAQPAQPAAAMVAASSLNELQHLQPPQTEVDNLLRKKRKAREHKACYPCRQRKVKCDLSRPCQTCRDREHPELCDYNPPSKRQLAEHSSIRDGDDDLGMQGGSITLGRSEFLLLYEKLESLENNVAELRRELRGSRALDPSLVSNGSSALPQASHDAYVPSTVEQPARSHVYIHDLQEPNAADSRATETSTVPTTNDTKQSIPHF